MNPWQRLKSGAPSVFAGDLRFSRSGLPPSEQAHIKLPGSLQPIRAQKNQITIGKSEPGLIPQALRSNGRGL